MAKGTVVVQESSEDTVLLDDELVATDELTEASLDAEESEDSELSLD